MIDLSDYLIYVLHMCYSHKNTLFYMIHVTTVSRMCIEYLLQHLVSEAEYCVVCTHIYCSRLHFE